MIIRSIARAALARFRTARTWFIRAVREGWRRVRRLRPLPVEVLVTSPKRRHRLEQEIRTALRRLERALGIHLPEHTAIVVQEVVQTDHALAGCYHLGRQPDGRSFAWIRLALQVEGRSLTADEVLSALADACITLATQQGTDPHVVVPLELLSSTAPRIDPLTPSQNGTGKPISIPVAHKTH